MYNTCFVLLLVFFHLRLALMEKTDNDDDDNDDDDDDHSGDIHGKQELWQFNSTQRMYFL